MIVPVDNATSQHKEKAGRLICHWVVSPVTGRPECRWTINTAVSRPMVPGAGEIELRAAA